MNRLFLIAMKSSKTGEIFTYVVRSSNLPNAITYLKQENVFDVNKLTIDDMISVEEITGLVTRVH